MFAKNGKCVGRRWSIIECFFKKKIVFEFLTSGRAYGREHNGNVRWRVEKRQKVWIWDRREDRRAEVRRGVVCKQEVRLRRDHVQGRHKGGGQVQEQCASHFAEEETLIPDEVVQAQGTDRFLRERGAQGVENCVAKSGHSDISVS